MYEEAENKKKRKAPEAEVKAADSGFLSEHDMQKRSWDDRLVVRRDGTTMILTFLKAYSAPSIELLKYRVVPFNKDEEQLILAINDCDIAAVRRLVEGGANANVEFFFRFETEPTTASIEEIGSRSGEYGSPDQGDGNLLGLCMKLKFNEGVEYFCFTKGIIGTGIFDGTMRKLWVRALSWAVKEGEVEVAAHCALEHDADVDDEEVVEGWGEKPVVAGMTGNLAMCALILAMGGRSQCCDGSMLDSALDSGNDECARFLLIHQCSKKWPDRFGPKPQDECLSGLGFAAALPPDIVAALLRHGMGSSRAVLDLTSPSLRTTPGARIVLQASQPWCAQNHRLFPTAQRKRVLFYLWLGKQIKAKGRCRGRRQTRTHSQAPAIDPLLWQATVIPFLVQVKGRPTIDLLTNFKARDSKRYAHLAASMAGFDADVQGWLDQK